ncbi:hypothetical protein [Arthrobacter sp. ISL-72]|uniref:hypothetical protein n=1 Tax=Arthrobacter sp. ISL-72 TaxID=2819114 RepID=UPI001BE876F8|nr:hypothetical protein [Arthrobacter sp. ISL-72]MBT2594028.1 hypothetical protein [Arthrobacter sp. ISL-72]
MLIIVKFLTPVTACFDYQILLCGHPIPKEAFVVRRLGPQRCCGDILKGLLHPLKGFLIVKP